MSNLMTTPYNQSTVFVSPPKNYTGAAGTEEYVNHGKAALIRVIIVTGAWAAGTAAVTAKQAKTAAGGSAKALGIDYVYIDGVKTAVTSDTFDLDTADTIYEFDLYADKLDVNNDFIYSTVAVASPGANADFYSIIYLGYHSRNISSSMEDLTT
jgi:hypothetical protein